MSGLEGLNVNEVAFLWQRNKKLCKLGLHDSGKQRMKLNAPGEPKRQTTPHPHKLRATDLAEEAFFFSLRAKQVVQSARSLT